MYCYSNYPHRTYKYCAFYRETGEALEAEKFSNLWKAVMHRIKCEGHVIPEQTCDIYVKQGSESKRIFSIACEYGLAFVWRNEGRTGLACRGVIREMPDSIRFSFG